MKRFATVLAVVLLFAAVLAAQDQASIVAPSQQKFMLLPNFPTCVKGAVLHGAPDSAQGVVLLAKGTTGCKIPWHWHTPNEEVGIVSGSAKLQMKGGQPTTMGPGGYAYLPAKHAHEFTCVTACTIFVAADGIFDIHYVDAAGNEIPPEQALQGGAKAGAPKPPAPKGEAGAAKGGAKGAAKAPPK